MSTKFMRILNVAAGVLLIAAGIYCLCNQDVAVLSAGLLLGVFLLLADRGYITGRTVPIIVDGVTSMEHYVNPIPAGLVLTGIVVSVSVSAVMLSLTVRIYQTYRTLDMDKLYMMMSHKKRRKEDGEQ